MCEAFDKKKWPGDARAFLWGRSGKLQGRQEFEKREQGQSRQNILWLAVNAKYSHTSLAVRYLRACVPGSEVMELTINHLLLDALGEIYERQPRVLGISCYIWNIEMVKKLLRLLPAALPDTVVICGGPEVSYETASFLREFPMVDFVVRGEGEEAVPALIDRLRAVDFAKARVQEISLKGSLPGVAMRRADGSIDESRAVTVADFAQVPFAYEEQELADLRERILYYETSRGCPFACAYCLSCATAGVRFLPLARVLGELEVFVRHDVRQVKFVDRTFNAKKSHFLPILQYILALPASVRTNFHFEVAIDYLDEEVLQTLAQMPRGRVQLEIGIQSTNEATLAAVSRVNHWQEIAAHIRRILSFHNMHLHVDLIIGLPGEGMASFHRSFNDVYALGADMLQLGFLKFLKGAAMMELVKPYRYRYMPMAPYEVLASDALTYGEIRWFHSFEQVFEYYYNAGRCRHTAAYFVQTGEHGDAFAFWQKFTDWWEARGFHRVGHATKNLYAYLRDFCEEAYGAEAELMDSLLRFDALLADGGRIRPAYLHWDMEKHQDVTAPFWRSGRPRAYVPGFVFRNWRDLRGKYHIEFFPYDMCALMKGESELPRRQTALLFDFTWLDVTCREVVL